MYIAIDTDTNKYYTDKDTYRLNKYTKLDLYVDILTINIAVQRAEIYNATCSLVMCLVSILNQ